MNTEQVEDQSRVSLTDTKKFPAWLVSYAYFMDFQDLKKFCSKRGIQLPVRDWVLDSGAFTAMSSGKVIRLQDYIDFCKKVRDEHQNLTEIFALDVIGNGRESLRNTEEMWRQGIEAIPCHHIGSSADELRHLCANYPKIALGGVARLTGEKKTRFLNDSFSIAFPKKIHGFGIGGKTKENFPWHSVDSSSWSLGLWAFGRNSNIGNLGTQKSKSYSKKWSRVALKKVISDHLENEQKLRIKWRSQMAGLLLTGESVTSRLALVGLKGHEDRISSLIEATSL